LSSKAGHRYSRPFSVVRFTTLYLLSASTGLALQMNRVAFGTFPLSLSDGRLRQPNGPGRSWAETQFAVRCTHATPSDYSKPPISGELDRLCGVRPELEPNDISADTNSLSSDGFSLCRRTEYFNYVYRYLDLI
jgi:hypothetical protein